jgi:DNA gyrase subunit B
MQPEEHLILREHVRKRPGMYFGAASAWGLVPLICEVIANPIDLFLQGQVSRINVQLDTDRLSVEDDGPGFPFETIGPDGITPFVEYHCTRRHDTPSAIGQVPHIHMSTLGGFGLAVVAAGCQELHIQSRRQGKLWGQRFIQGQPVGAAQVIGEAEGSGTIVQITFDKELFNQAVPLIEHIRQQCRYTVYLFPGLTIQFGAELFYSEHGLIDLAKLEYPGSKHIETFHCNIRCGEVEINAAAIGHRRRGLPDRKAWVNGIQARYGGGTHVTAFDNALKQAKYSPQAFYIHAIMHDPEFAGPTKTKLDVPQMQSEMETGLFQALEAWQSAKNSSNNTRSKGFGRPQKS